MTKAPPSGGAFVVSSAWTRHLTNVAMTSLYDAA